MKQYIVNTTAVLLVAMLGVTACRTKDKAVTPVYPVADSGQVKLEFFNMVGNSALSLNNQWYKNEHNDSFKVTTFNYYISNIKLNSATASYTEDNSYHLIRQEDLTTTYFDMSSVPYGTYTSITFTIGVDSARNLAGSQTGALDVANNMFWSWTTGYIMMKFEGVSPKSPQVNNVLTLHTGGFSGTYNVLKTVTLNLTSPITVGSGTENHIHLSADILAMFKSPNVIDFATISTIHGPGAEAKMLADDYAGMFSVSYAGL